MWPLLNQLLKHVIKPTWAYLFMVWVVVYSQPLPLLFTQQDVYIQPRVDI